MTATASPAASPGTPPTPKPARAGRIARGSAALGGMVAAGVGVALVVLIATGAVGVPAVFDPGAPVRYGLPIARTLHDLAAALTVGSLVLGVWLAGPATRDRSGALDGARAAAVAAGARFAGVWLVAGIATMILTVADVAGVPVTSPGFATLVASFATQIDLGRALAVSVLLVAVVANLAMLATSVTTAAWAAVMAVAALLPLALAGHASGSNDHMNAVDSLALHLVGATVWVGGLAALLITARHLDTSLGTVAGRYSALAGWCFVLVAGSGLVNAALRLGSWRGLATTYGLLVAGKAAALLLLGAAGWWHRRTTLPGLAGPGRGDPARRWAFLRLAAGEVVVMGATVGLAVALSRSAPPDPEVTAGDPVAALLGYPAPPPVSARAYLTEFYPSVLWLTAAAAGLGWYLWAVRRLRRRGDRWPVVRTLWWTLGCLALAYVTSGGPAAYGRLAFSTHMLQHMILMVVVPFFLVFGAPVTLALRTVPARRDGSLGIRETMLALVHARVLRVLGHPVVASILFTGSLVVFYYTPAFELAMFTHGGHLLMTAHFLGVGYLFVWSLVGPDPGPVRPAYPLRMVLLLVTLAFHAFFGVTLMQSASLLAPDWWAALGRTDTAALLADQQNGGAIAWATGDLPSLAVALALIVGWVRSDAAERRRHDRQADRDDDAELRAYNERLAAMARRDAGT